MTGHFETILTLAGVIIGILATLLGVVWKARGYVDRLNTTDSRLAQALEDLNTTTKAQHAENRARFERIERRLKLSS